MLGVDPRGSYITELYPSLTYTQTLETDGGHTASEAHSPLHHEVVVGGLPSSKRGKWAQSPPQVSLPSGASGGWSRAGGLSQLEELISLEKPVLTILPPQQILCSHPQPLLRKPGLRLSKPGSNAQSSLQLEGGNPRVFTSSPSERPWASGLTSDLLVLIIVIDPVLELGSLTLWGPAELARGQ